MTDKNTGLGYDVEVYPLEIDSHWVRFFKARNVKWWWCDTSRASAVDLLLQINQHPDHPMVKLYLQSDYNQNMTLEEFLEATRATT